MLNPIKPLGHEASATWGDGVTKMKTVWIKAWNMGGRGASLRCSLFVFREDNEEWGKKKNRRGIRGRGPGRHKLESLHEDASVGGGVRREDRRMEVSFGRR